MTADTIAKALGGRRAGGGWIGRCPAHEDRKPSLSITEAKGGKVLVRCHAGCGQEQVIAALRSRGLWTANGPHSLSCPTQRIIAERKPEQDDAKRTEARSPSGSIQRRQTKRGRVLSPLARPASSTAPTLRFHAGLKHPSGGIWPAMVALVTNGVNGTPLAIHRTFLARDGAAKRRSSRRR